MTSGKSQVWLLVCSRCSARVVHGEKESVQEEEKEGRNPSGASRKIKEKEDPGLWSITEAPGGKVLRRIDEQCQVL